MPRPTRCNSLFRALDQNGSRYAGEHLRMSDANHIKPFRLFDRVQGDSSGRGFELTEWEREHLQACEECRGLEAFFRRQIADKPHLYSNGDVSPTDAWYRNVCCNFELFVPAGKKFPDCRRHKNLPTSWKCTDEPTKKQSA